MRVREAVSNICVRLRIPTPHNPSNTDRKKQLLRIVTVYTSPQCQPCKATKRWLDKNDVVYREVDVSQNPADLAAIKELGYVAAPVIIVSTGDPETEIHWQGLHVDNLKKYTHSTKEAA